MEFLALVWVDGHLYRGPDTGPGLYVWECGGGTEGALWIGRDVLSWENMQGYVWVEGGLRVVVIWRGKYCFSREFVYRWCFCEVWKRRVCGEFQV